MYALVIANRLFRVINLAAFQSLTNESSIENDTAGINREVIVVSLPDFLVRGDRPKWPFPIV